MLVSYGFIKIERFKAVPVYPAGGFHRPAGAVSYTHLDVYKRQVYAMGEHLLLKLQLYCSIVSEKSNGFAEKSNIYMSCIKFIPDP